MKLGGWQIGRESSESREEGQPASGSGSAGPARTNRSKHCSSRRAANQGRPAQRLGLGRGPWWSTEGPATAQGGRKDGRRGQGLDERSLR